MTARRVLLGLRVHLTRSSLPLSNVKRATTARAGLSPICPQVPLRGVGSASRVTIARLALIASGHASRANSVRRRASQRLLEIARPATTAQEARRQPSRVALAGIYAALGIIVQPVAFRSKYAQSTLILITLALTIPEIACPVRRVKRALAALSPTLIVQLAPTATTTAWPTRVMPATNVRQALATRSRVSQATTNPTHLKTSARTAPRANIVRISAQ